MIAELRRIWQEAFGDSDEALDNFSATGFSPDRCHYICDEDTPVSALYWFDCELNEKKLAYIYAVATLDEWRGRGIATRLLTEALNLIDASGRFDCAALIPSSLDSLRLYARLGFEDSRYPMTFPTSDYLGTGSIPHDLAMLRPCK